MKITSITVLATKKVTKDMNSWGCTYGANADLDKKDDWLECIKVLDTQLRGMLGETLPLLNKKLDPFLSRRKERYEE
ncbi:unnamed protein product [marine sediment metagenome]|uniref:Uncharacterized protein n=1 Tax=marine sediment metagenome TaxID=412755 RepID=X0XZW5_9ZZZZ